MQKNRNTSDFLVYVSEVTYFNRLKLRCETVIPDGVITGCIKNNDERYFQNRKTKETFDLHLGLIHANIKFSCHPRETGQILCKGRCRADFFFH